MAATTRRKRKRRVSLQPTARGLVVRNPSETLRRLLSTTDHRLERDVTDGMIVAVARSPLFDDLLPVLERNVINVPRALIPVLAQWVGKPLATNTLPTILPLPAPISASGIDRQLACRIREARELTVCHGPSVRIAQIIAQTAKAFPTARITVSVIGREDSREILGELRNAGIRSRSVLQRTPDSAAQVVVGAPLKHDVSEHDAISFTVGHRTGLSADIRLQAEYSPHARQILLLPANRRFAQSEWDRLYAVFGFHKLLLPQIGRRQRQVITAWQTFAGRPLPFARTATLLQLKEGGIKRHPVRNRLVASTARGFAADFSSAADRFAPAAGLPQWGGGIVVLVEDITHAIELAKYLPGWQILHHEDLQVGDLQNWERDILRRPAAISDRPRLIVTAAAVSRVPWAKVGVVVRADGCPGLPPIEPNHLVVPVELERPLLICDFNDRHHPQFRKWTRSRREAYDKHEWFAAGCDPCAERIRRFIERRTQEQD